MRKIKEVCRLKFDVGLGLRQIARSCSICLGTVHEYLQRAEAAGVTWPLGGDSQAPNGVLMTPCCCLHPVRSASLLAARKAKGFKYLCKCIGSASGRLTAARPIRSRWPGCLRILTVGIRFVRPDKIKARADGRNSFL
jgi:hypothetical protein